VYQISRSMYRELCREIAPDRYGSTVGGRQRLLQACEASVERLAHDRHYFAHPTRTLFNDVRMLFPLSRQLRVHQVIEHHMTLAATLVDRAAEQGISCDGTPLCCHATTRKGGACQRAPLPGSLYCPSHKHLGEGFELAEELEHEPSAVAALQRRRASGSARSGLRALEARRRPQPLSR
jgi:hypothetical protein